MLAYLIAALAAWNLAPIVALAFLPVPSWAKARAARSMLRAAALGLLVIVPALLAPVVVPLALLFTPREANALPWLFRWWDNDVSINGDQPEGAETYYALGHDRRSFWARYVWLGWRNRASRLAIILGHRYRPGEYDDAQSWGDPKTGRDHEGWSLNRRGAAWQLYAVRFLPAGLCLRSNYGFKVWAGPGDRRPVACVVNVTASILAQTRK